MVDNRKGEAIAGVAVLYVMIAGFAGFVVGAFACYSRDFVGAGVCLAAAGLSFGLVANASLRN